MAGDGQKQLFFDVFSAKTARRTPHVVPVTVADQPVPLSGPHTYTVRELIGSVRRHIEGGFAGTLSVAGEVSNCRPAGSGHVYFTLKDGEAQLPVVLFRQKALLLRFRLRDGMAVRVRGRLSLYETRGQLQLMADWVEEQGTGALQRAYEELRARLMAEGLFNREKKALPAFPHCIGIITSVSGAVIQDIVNVVRRRHAPLNLLVYPAAMQGTGCAKSISEGIKWFNRHPERVQVIMIARGGGSLEDLAGFNEEGLARAIAGSDLPVVSAIGHETDTTIADFVADVRAPTPSAAAELITAAQERIKERVTGLARRVERATTYQLVLARQQLGRLAAEQVLRRVQEAVGRRVQRIDELDMRLPPAIERGIRVRVARVAALEARLQRCDAKARLLTAQHRLAIATDRLTTLPTLIVQRRRVRIEYWDTLMQARALRVLIDQRQEKLSQFEKRLQRCGAHLGTSRHEILLRLTTRLEDLSPLAVLQRGYAIAYASDGRVLRSAREIAASEQVRVRLGQGSLNALVLETETETQ